MVIKITFTATYTYNLATFLSELLIPVIPNEHYAKDSLTFCEEIPTTSTNDYFIVSYDFYSLFTSIRITERIKVAAELILQNLPNSKISKNELKRLFKFATSASYFMFKGKSSCLN